MSSAATALRALELIASHQPLGVSELARRLEIPKPTAQRALRTLADADWIQRSESQSGRWVLTTKPLRIANGIGREFGLREAALGPMTRLAERTTESVHLALLDRLDVVTIDDIESTQVVRIHWPIGSRSPAYASANGKAILATLPRDRVRQHLPDKLRALTSETITTMKDFDAELDRVVERGYAVQRGEQRADVASIAAVVGRPGQPVASLSLFMPAHRFPEAEEAHFGAMVRSASEQVTAALTVNSRGVVHEV
ncbi:transcriptional regulator, IclR family [Modestobacter sp. DSM 44400]|uniref:IclR family transcriptional regulator n=1 Tax=Modestobacter sp. DSM 44400 TaxID=1550230 RepID=UPI0008960E79|nr:IclR family transcriptional regulator [Modestobacter sp. DSM 44400]SDX66055.1 transcriptional regulator, IclR family [Modestobacter sp. DSM 44400]